VVADVDDDRLLRYLLETGLCDVNIKDRNGCTAIHFAAQLGRESAVALLLVRI
jgi:ankyrin repeat protein